METGWVAPFVDGTRHLDDMPPAGRPPSTRGWRPGRQGTGYLKLLLAKGATWDAWLLKYPAGTGVQPHRDPVAAGREHHRLNIVLRGDKQALRVGLHSRAVLRHWLGGRITWLRPDWLTHAVPPVSRERLVLSIGWVREERE